MTRILEDHELDYKEFGLPDAKDMGWMVRKVQKMEKADGHEAAKNYVSDFLASDFFGSMPTLMDDISQSAAGKGVGIGRVDTRRLAGGYSIIFLAAARKAVIIGEPPTRNHLEGAL